MKTASLVTTTTVAACVLALAACSGRATVPPTAGGPPASVATIRLVPHGSGYLGGAKAGFVLYGSKAQVLEIDGLDANGNVLTGANRPSIAVTASDGEALDVRPTHTAPGYFSLRAVTAPQGGTTCASCAIVHTGRYALNVTVSQAAVAKHFRVPLTIAHKIVYVSLSPFPNPAGTNLDAILQYYDDNARPSVIWDDFNVKNTSHIVAIAGLAVGADGTLYAANLGFGAPGTVTEYPRGSTDPAPAKTLSAPGLLAPQGVTVDVAGDVYVADSGLETLTRFPANGKPVTLKRAWSAGAQLWGIAIDRNANLYVSMADVGSYAPPNHRDVGTIAVLPAAFDWTTVPNVSLQSSKTNGLNEPYGIAMAPSGALYVANNYESIINSTPNGGTYPMYSTLTRYDRGIASQTALPDSTASAGLAWPLAVALDVAGTVYVGNNEPPPGGSGSFSILTYAGSFANGAKPIATLPISTLLPAAYKSNYLNIQSIAVDPGPLQYGGIVPAVVTTI